ncbi:Os09g0502566 [Oryza sativa Japonica Group]|uniref:Os09g0502566 protein n=1 Tax=Oryza sativa subsp. japonica TaxID=39947 RepID=A0A0P0XPI9_ORYSJ|nr:Os09g0502566 [Oryza sativa Japonica Group]
MSSGRVTPEFVIILPPWESSCWQGEYFLLTDLVIDPPLRALFRRRRRSRRMEMSRFSASRAMAAYAGSSRGNREHPEAAHLSPPCPSPTYEDRGARSGRG